MHKLCGNVNSKCLPAGSHVADTPWGGGVMEFQSILFADTTQEAEQAEPAFFQDLKLDYILNIIRHFVEGYNIHQYYYTVPFTESLIKYRQQVFNDLADKGLRQAVQKFCFQMKKSRSSHRYSLQCEDTIQAAAYHLEAALLYWDALAAFGKELSLYSLSSDGMNSLKEYIIKYIAGCQEKHFDKALQHADALFSKLHFRLSVGKDCITVEEEEETGTDNYLLVLSELLQVNPEETEVTLNGIFPNALELSYLEAALVQILKRNNPEVFNGLQEFYKLFPDFYSGQLLRFEEEVQFYISFLDFKERTERYGYPLEIPEISMNKDFAGEGVYDIALVWKNADRDYKVIPNNFQLGSKPSFFVVTGPNQGGKTTFARSMGQAVYFSIMGMPANAESLTVPFFKGISTHFEAEEKIQSNSGKLKEEIGRLVPMLKKENKCQFVVLNELFTTATTNDALVMGKKVMDYFLEKGCYGIYVTHIQELAEETGQIISLVAQVGDDKDRKCTYHMVHMKAQGYGYPGQLVEKFQLSYKDIIRRLSC